MIEQNMQTIPTQNEFVHIWAGHYRKNKKQKNKTQIADILYHDILSFADN